MNLEVFSRDIIPIIQTGILTIGLISIVLVWYQIKENKKWNKMSCQHNFYNIELGAKLENELHEALNELDPPIDSTTFEKISEDDSRRIIGNYKTYAALKNYLNDCENLAVSIRMGAADPEYAFAIHSAGLIKAVKKYEVFIKHVQEKYGDNDIFIEAKNLCQTWEKMQKKIDRKKLKKTTSQVNPIS